MVERICVDDVDRSGCELEFVEVARQDVAIVLARIEIDADSERAEIEKRFHFGADSGTETKNTAAGPVDIEREQSFPEHGPKLRVVLPEAVGLELGLLVFKVGFVGNV